MGLPKVRGLLVGEGETGVFEVEIVQGLLHLGWAVDLVEDRKTLVTLAPRYLRPAVPSP